MKTIQEFFKYGLDRDIPELWQPPKGLQINLGPGDKKKIYYLGSDGVLVQAIGIGPGMLSAYPEWHWPEDHLLKDQPDRKWGSFRRDSIAAIHCYQFIEHLTGDDAVALLRECEDVLMPGGCMYIAAPYYRSSMAYQALDHKSFWNEEVWNWLFGNEYYGDNEPKSWRFRVHACFIMGIVERNLNLFTQLVKWE